MQRRAFLQSLVSLPIFKFTKSGLTPQMTFATFTTCSGTLVFDYAGLRGRQRASIAWADQPPSIETMREEITRQIAASYANLVVEYPETAVFEFQELK